MAFQQKLEGKKILFFAPAFFNYEHKIKQKMETMGAIVYLFDERAVKKPFYRALLKVCPSIFTKTTEKYYNKIFNQVKDVDFDFIFVIKCDMLMKKSILQLKLLFPNAKTCLYLYDSISNIPGIINRIDLFDITSSFDRFDSKDIDILKFRPLFFGDEFEKNTDCKKEYLYDLAFCGTIHSDRYKVLNAIEKQAKALNLRYYKFYYLQARFMYNCYKFFKKEFRNTTKDDFTFNKKSTKEISLIGQITKVIIDIQHPKQTGLTMRTIEMIGMQKKLITTNMDIMNYDFYNPINICIINRKNPLIEIDFIEKPYVPIPNDIYNKYRLENWILEVLGIL